MTHCLHQHCFRLFVTVPGLEEGNKQEEIDHKKKKAEAEQALKNVEQEAMSKFKYLSTSTRCPISAAV